MIVLSVLATLLAAVVVAHGAWWSFLCAVALPSPRRKIQPAPEMRLVVIVPAHNEASLVSATVESLLRAARGHHGVLVVADNCTDSTADLARVAGASVIERRDPRRRGKSYALDAGLAHVARLGTPPDAVAFVDADSTVSANFFDAVAARLAAGPSAVQVHYVAAAGDSDLGRLRKLAFSLIHWSRALGASRLGIGVGLKGNGMALRWALVADGFNANGLAEDAALTLTLAIQGVPVAFEPRATVTGHMATSYNAARRQDERWERGRLALVPRALRAAGLATAKGRPSAALAALDLASLPFSLLVVCAFVPAVASGVGAVPWWLALAPAASLAGYLGLGLAAARTRPSDLLAFASAPRFLAHKLRVFLAIGLRGETEWHRTERN